MALSTDDLKLWKEFTKKCKESSKKSTIETERGKNLLKQIRENLKNNAAIFQMEADYIDKSFRLEKNSTLGIDRKSDKRLMAGKYKIDASLDLHGLTLDEAYNKVKLFFTNAMNNGCRCILIITGKGLHSKDTTIKSSIEKWLSEPYFSNNIIKYTDAAAAHGGSGALYVLLKNNKQSPKINII